MSRLRPLLAFALGLALLPAAPPVARAVATLCVNPGGTAGCYATIAAAVAAAGPGDTINIAAGTYQEHDIAIAKDLTLAGAGAGNTVVDAGPTPPGTFRGFYIPAGARVAMSGLKVTNANAGSNGGGILNAGSLTLIGVTLDKNTTAFDGGGVANGVTGVLTLTNVTLTNNTSNGGNGGGGVYNENTMTIVGSAVISNTAKAGGGILVGATGRALLDNTAVEYNRAYEASGLSLGGGIRSAGALTLTATSVRYNRAMVGLTGSRGGGIYQGGGSLSATGGAVQGNEAIHGAGVTVAGGAAAFNGVSFLNNLAESGDGGGLRVEGGAASVSGATFAGNYAAHRGGGVYNLAALTVTQSIVRDNDAYVGGGGIGNGGTMTVTGSTVAGNTASVGGDGYGGGISNGGSLTVVDSDVISNTAHFDGGGIYNGGTLSLSRATVSGNVSEGGDVIGATPYGGGGVFNGGNATIVDSLISGNKTNQLDGGGLYNRIGGTTVTGSTISGNTAAQDGGGAKNEGGTLTLLNATVSGNAAPRWGGGVLSEYGQTDLTHATVVSNTAAAGGGVYNLTTYPTATITIRNSVFANSPPAAANCAQFPGSLNVVSQGYNLSDDNAFATFCPSFGGSDRGGTNAKLGPLADYGGPRAGPDLQTIPTHLPLAGSPLIDAIPIAANGCGTAYTTDQRGFARPVNGDADPAVKCDIGAVEATLADLATPTPTATPTATPGNTATPEGVTPRAFLPLLRK